jgi:hypothetical protein
VTFLFAGTNIRSQPPLGAAFAPPANWGADYSISWSFWQSLVFPRTGRKGGGLVGSLLGRSTMVLMLLVEKTRLAYSVGRLGGVTGDYSW